MYGNDLGGRLSPTWMIGATQSYLLFQFRSAKRILTKAYERVKGKMRAKKISEEREGRKTEKERMGKKCV